MRRVGQMSKDSQSATQAEEDFNLYQQQLADLEAQMNSEIASLSLGINGTNIELETISVRPRKSDISVDKVGLVWWPQ